MLCPCRSEGRRLRAVSETGERDLARWSFPAGSVGHSDSVKGYDVECTDGPVGTEAPPDWGMVDQFERGMLGGGFVWPYTDV